MSDKKPHAAAVDAELLPTVREHVERAALERWQIWALLARLSGEHIDGVRRFADGVSLSTRMSAEDFDAALTAFMQGRV